MARRKPKRSQGGAEIAETFDIDPDVVRRWCQRGCPHTKQGPGKPNLFNDAEVAAWMKSVGLTGKKGRPAEQAPKTLEAARLRKENALADRHEIWADQQRGKLVDYAETERIFINVFTSARNQLSGLGAQLAGQLVGLDAPEIQTAIEARVGQILDQLSKAPRRPATVAP